MATSILTKGNEEDESLLTPVKIRWFDDNTDLFFQKQIGDFTVLQKLGSGRYGVVKSGEDTKRHIQVAIKLIAKDNLTDIEKCSIKQEAQIMNFLAHTNIIQLYEVIENKQYICMVMEYAAGGELFDHVTRQTRLQEVEARKLYVQILNGLGYCHANQIIHRDIKAENIFLDEKLEKIKIGDWGFATVYQSGTTLETSCGSLEYAAPEILSGKPHLGPEVDVWALGVLLYFMVCGWLPFRAATDFDVFSKIKRGQYRPVPNHISDELKNLIEKVFNVDHNTRPSIVDIQNHLWSKKANEDPNYLKRPKLPRLLQLQIRQYRRNKSDPQFMSPRSAADSGEMDSLSYSDYLDDESSATPSKEEFLQKIANDTPHKVYSSPVAVAGDPDIPTSSPSLPTSPSASITTSQKRRSLKRGAIKNNTNNPPRMASTEEITDPKKIAEMNNKAIAEAAAERPRPQQLRGKAARSKSQSMRPAVRSKELAAGEEPKKKTLRRKRKDSNARLPKSNRQYFDEGEEEGLAEPPDAASQAIETPATTPPPPEPTPTPVPEQVEAPPTTTVNTTTTEPQPRSVSPMKNGHINTSPVRSRSPSGGKSTAANELEQTPGSDSGSGRVTPTRSSPVKRKSKPENLLFPPRPRGKIQNSNFSVLHVDSSGLGKIQTSNELEILSIENEDNLFVVVVSARSEKGQEAKIVELMKKFEQNATKLKRSKSQENIFADVMGAVPSEDGDPNTRKLLGPRRTLTWDVRSNKPIDPPKPIKIARAHSSENTTLPEIAENANIRKCASAGSSLELSLPIPEHPPTEGTPTLSIPEEESPPIKISPKKHPKKKHKKMKVKMFKNPVNNNRETDNNPPVVTSPEEEIDFI